jgi:O-antigen/teichoic acid export membrane protein
LFRGNMYAIIIAGAVANAPENISIFGIGMRLIAVAAMTINVIWAVRIPNFSGLSEKGDVLGAKALLRSLSNTTGLLCSFILVNIAVFGYAFLHVWINKPWVDQSQLITLIVLPSTFAGILCGPVSGMQTGMGHFKIPNIIAFAEAFTCVVASALLAQEHGIMGVAVGMSIPTVFFRMIVFPWSLRFIGISFGEYYSMFARTGLVTIVYLAAIGGFALLRYDNIFQLAAACVASTIIFAVILLLLVPEFRAWSSRKFSGRTA